MAIDPELASKLEMWMLGFLVGILLPMALINFLFSDDMSDE